MATNPTTLKKENPDKFSLLYELNGYERKALLTHSLSFLENIEDIDCLEAISKTCKFFSEFLTERIEIIRYYSSLIGNKNIFFNWQEIARLPEQGDNIYKVPDDIVGTNYITRGKCPITGTLHIAFKFQSESGRNLTILLNSKDSANCLIYYRTLNSEGLWCEWLANWSLFSGMKIWKPLEQLSKKQQLAVENVTRLFRDNKTKQINIGKARE